MSEEPYDDFTQEEGDRRMLGAQGDPSYERSSIGHDHHHEHYDE